MLFIQPDIVLHGIRQQALEHALIGLMHGLQELMQWVGGGANERRSSATGTDATCAGTALDSGRSNTRIDSSNAERDAMFTRFWGFIGSLPCEECRAHATAYSRRYPPDFTGSAGLQTWAWQFHNAVNKRLGKSLMSAEDYRREYAEDFSAENWRLVSN